MKHIILLVVAATFVMADVDIDALGVGNDKLAATSLNFIHKAQPGENLVFSSFSLLSPLAQLALASDGDTRKELLNVLGVNDANDESLKNVFKEMKSAINIQIKRGQIELKSASRVYLAKDLEIDDNFAAAGRDAFDSDSKNLDFGNTAAAIKDINSWVEQQTNNRIKNLVDSNTIKPSTRAVLVNALYFKGAWQKPFNESLTKNLDFHLTKNKAVKVATMNRKDEFNYAEIGELNAKVLVIHYRQMGAIFRVILPNDVDGISNLVEKLKDPRLAHEARNAARSREVDVYLPKFKIETETKLVDVLKEAGVKKVFSPGAKLGKLVKKTGDLQINDAIQKAFIEVNEVGAEAGAANSFNVVGAIPGAPPPPVVFRADHPFYYEIATADYILFSGIVAKPSESASV